MTLTDSHCHLPPLKRQAELDKVINNAREAGVERLINIGTSLSDNFKVIEVAKKYPQVYASVAIYPHENRDEDLRSLMTRLEHQATSSGKVVAIGECGIDISEWKNQRPLSEQIELFEAQIRLSLKLNLPLIIHNRNASRPVLDILSRYPGVRGVVHCFDSGWEVAKEFLDAGLYISFSGLITYPSRTDLLETVKKVESNRYLLETDSPYLLPEPVKTEHKMSGIKIMNEPKYVRIVAQKVADVRGISPEEAAVQATENTVRIFKYN